MDVSLFFARERRESAPDDPDLWPLRREWLTLWRKDQRNALKYDDKYYRAKEFAWVPSNLVSAKIMSWEMYFIDSETGEYTVDKFLEHGEKEYGGYDNVLLWQAFPRIGIDERNQFDFYRTRHIALFASGKWHPLRLRLPRLYPR